MSTESQSEITSQITLTGATWQQLHDVIPKELFNLKQAVEIVFPQLPSTLSLRQREGINGREILIKGIPLCDYPAGYKIPSCLACGDTKKKTQRICETCYKKTGSFQVNFTCPSCQEKFSVTSKILKQRLHKNPSEICCSPQCAGKRKTILKKIPCMYCTKPFKPLSHLTKCCSKECANKLHSIRMQGSGNSNYRHGCDTNDFRTLRPQVLIRDNYTCAGCGGTEKMQQLKDGSLRTNLCVHHIDHKRTNNTLSNLITLCRQCHVAHHQVTDKCGLPSPFPLLSSLAIERTLCMISK